MLLLRYIEIGPDRLPHPVERLLGVFCTGDSSGAELCDRILKSLSEAGVDLQWVIEQEYDAAGNVHVRGTVRA